VVEPALTMKDREVAVSGNKRKRKEGKSCAADGRGRICSFCMS